MIFPSKINEFIKDKNYSQDDVGMSNSQVLIFDDMVLKIEKRTEWKEKYDFYKTQNIVNMMNWSQDFVIVPKVLCFEQTEEFDFLLMSKINGKMACDSDFLENSNLLLELLAKTLKKLWSVDVKNCPRVNSLENKLALAEYFVNHNLVDMEDAEPSTFGPDGFENPKELLKWLKENQPKDFEPVLSHGDFCLPNVFFEGENLSGLIDLGDFGVADKYQDIALCYRSLKHNFDGSFGGKIYEDFNADLFFEKLGLEPDWEKIRYYTLLDELFQIFEKDL